MAVSLQIESVLHRAIFVILSQEKDNDGGSRSSSPALGSVVIWGRGLGGSRGGDPPGWQWGPGSGRSLPLVLVQIGAAPDEAGECRAVWGS